MWKVGSCEVRTEVKGIVRCNRCIQILSMQSRIQSQWTQRTTEKYSLISQSILMMSVVHFRESSSYNRGRYDGTSDC